MFGRVRNDGDQRRAGILTFALSSKAGHHSRLLLAALFGPDAPGRRCPLIGEEQKFAARCQSDAIDPKRTFDGCRFRIGRGRGRCHSFASRLIGADNGSDTDGDQHMTNDWKKIFSFE
jgi:hypothetical protein